MNLFALILAATLSASPDVATPPTDAPCPTVDQLTAQKDKAKQTLEALNTALNAENPGDTSDLKATAQKDQNRYEEMKALAAICQQRKAGEEMATLANRRTFAAIAATSSYQRSSKTKAARGAALTVLYCVHEQGKTESTEATVFSKHEELSSAYKAQAKSERLKLGSCTQSGMRNKIECAMGMGDESCLLGRMGETMTLVDEMKLARDH